MKARLSYILLGILLVLLHSCTDDTFTAKEQTPVVISFSMNVNSPVLTRAGISTGIETSSIKVFAYNTDGSFVAELPMLKMENSSDGVQFVCAFTGAIPENASPSNAPQYKFMVLANCTNKQYGLSYDANGIPDLEKLDYSYPLENSIPLWGVKSYTFEYLNNELKEIQELGNIDVLRAAAKVRVKLSPELKALGFDILGAKIKSVANSGYSVPSKWNEVSKTDLFHNNSNAFRPVADALLLKDVNLTRTEVADTISTYIYVPEIANGTDEAENAIWLTIKNNNDGSVYEFDYTTGVKFRKYVDGKATNEQFNIVRNHFYDYTITAINLGLELTLTVADWIEGPTWDLDQYESPQNTNLLSAPFDKASAPASVPVVRYTNGTEEGACTMFFKMSGPMGISSWRPTLLNASARDYAVRVYEVEINGTDYVVKNEEITGDIPANNTKFYAIKVVAINQAVLTRTEPINLAIGYNAQWNPSNISLLVVNSNGYWPVPSGYTTDQLYVQIKQQQ